MKHLLLWVCAFITCAIATTGCSNDDDNPQQMFTVTFDSQGGSEVKSQQVPSGGKATEPADPTKADASFGGWYTGTDYAKAWNFDTDVVTSDMTLYAQWNTASSSNRLATAIYITPAPDNEIIAVNAASESFTLEAYAIAQDGSQAANSKVTFTYDKDELSSLTEAWDINADGLTEPDEKIAEYSENDRSYLTFHPLSGASGDISLTIASEENPSVKQTVTLKIVGETDLAAQFTALVESLPQVSQLTFDNIEEHWNNALRAETLYNELTNKDEVATEYATLEKFINDMENTWEFITYKKSEGNKYILNDDQEVTYNQSGTFPNGTYEDNSTKYELKNNGDFSTYFKDLGYSITGKYQLSTGSDENEGTIIAKFDNPLN